MRRVTVSLALITLSFASILFTLAGQGYRALSWWYLFFSPMALAAFFFGLRGAVVMSAFTVICLVGLYERATLSFSGLLGSLPALDLGAAAGLVTTPVDDYANALLGTVMMTAGAIFMGYLRDRRWFDRRAATVAAIDPDALVSPRRFRELLGDLLDNSRVGGRGGAVLVVYFSGFKGLVESLGHDREERLLAAVADRMETQLRSADFLCRLAPGELALTLTNVTDDQTEVTSRALLNNLRQFAFELGDRREILPVTIGVTRYPGTAYDADHLIEQARQALKRSASMGESGVYFYRKVVSSLSA